MPQKTKSTSRERGRPQQRGWVKKKPFQHIDEVKEYFSHSKIACLLCGKEFRSLGSHLLHTHNTSSDEYKLQFGIPLKYGLAGCDFRRQSSRHMKKLRKAGLIRHAPTRETIEKMLKGRRRRRAVAEVTRRESAHSISKRNKSGLKTAR